MPTLRQTLLASTFILSCMAVGATASDADFEQMCMSMRVADFSQIEDAPSTILAAKIDDFSGTRACELSGYTHRQAQFKIRIPEGPWNGRMYFQGCGGFCGGIIIDRANDALARGYTTVSTNMGHVSSPIDALWAYDNPEAEIDFAYRATHQVASASKSIISAFTGREPDLSLFHGCSTGGRQGLMSAERYPDDFDAIIAGAPVINYIHGSGLQLLWSSLVADGALTGDKLSASDVTILAEHVMSQCDAIDGATDGVIAAPRQCVIDWAVPICSDAGACLSENAKTAAKAIYDGPREAFGREKLGKGELGSGASGPEAPGPEAIESRTLRGPEFGSEPKWIGSYVSTTEGPSLYLRFMQDLFRYLAFETDPGPTWQPDISEIQSYREQSGVMHRLFSADQGKIGGFLERGGKLLLYQGWRDQSVVPATTLDYLDKIADLPGRDAQVRAFMVPGLNHCVGGVGAHSVDWLSLMETWLETGTAPDAATAESPEDTTVKRVIAAEIAAPNN